jgi:hypothetical protein
MVSVQARRDAVAFAMTRGVSQRRACTLLVVSRVVCKLIWLAVLRCRAQAVRACSVLWLGGFMVR